MNGSNSADRPLQAHSLAELYLYLAVTPCPNCGRGPLAGDRARPSPDAPVGRLAITPTCKSCKHRFELVFDVPADQLAEPDQTSPTNHVIVNPSQQRSAIIDVAGWITLFRAITQAAADAEDKVEARYLGLEAAQCLEEALKFYDPDNDLPPASALFHDQSRNLLRDHPDRFARSRLVGLRSKLPSLDVMQRQLAAGDKARQPWWKLWN
ncbi:MAG: hypothetical protein ACE5GE_13105 [Phycisphaerae bacterium]